MSVESEKRYRKIREIVLAGTDGKCVKCGSRATEVHHVNGREDASLKNLRPLCRICHMVAPNGDLYWEWEESGKTGSEIIHDRMLTDLPITETDRDIFEQVFRVAVGFWRDNNTAKATREALTHRKSSGFPAGAAPYGWSAQPRTETEKRARISKPLIASKYEQKIISKVRHMRGSGLSYRQIADSLNKQGYRTRSGGEWVKQYVIGILKNNKGEAAC